MCQSLSKYGSVGPKDWIRFALKAVHLKKPLVRDKGSTRTRGANRQTAPEEMDRSPKEHRPLGPAEKNLASGNEQKVRKQDVD